jgi:hypothetical protein
MIQLRRNTTTKKAAAGKRRERSAEEIQHIERIKASEKIEQKKEGR